jgi:hypothetical protein
MQVFDNFLEKSYFSEIEKMITMHELPWYTTRDISNEGQFFDNLYYQTHTFFEDYKILSLQYFNKLLPFLQQLNVKALIRMRANMYAGREKLTVHGWHVDYNYENKTALLYINDNDGFTEFEGEGKVESKANRLVIFDSNKKHRSTNCTNSYARYNININYF